mmetsp:Transcript_21932/g.55809  ORF Transcript_21932/g.55809 Transcript_21932/m.55809 type:complete len:624 (-) Transcript_21932:125-1996(-)
MAPRSRDPSPARLVPPRIDLRAYGVGLAGLAGSLSSASYGGFEGLGGDRTSRWPSPAPPSAAAATALGGWSRSPMNSARSTRVLQQPCFGLTEHINSVSSCVEHQYDWEQHAANRRLQHVEEELHGVSGRLEEEKLRENDWRDRLTGVEGSFGGLLQEQVALARRLDALDDRLRAKASGADEATRHGVRELQQRSQALERQSRLSAAAAEDSQRSLSARLRRSDVALEDLEWRLTTLEEECRAGAAPTPAEAPEQVVASDPFATIREEELGELDLKLKALVEQVSVLQSQMQNVGASHVTPEALVALDRRLSSVDERARVQLEELRTSLASVRVKVDSQLQRQTVLTERLEKAHFPGLEALREELADQRSRDFAGLEALVVAAGKHTDVVATDTSALAERVEVLSQRVSGGESGLRAVRRETHNVHSALRSALGSSWPSLGSSQMPGLQAVPEQHEHTGSFALPALQEQLVSMADQLEVLDDVARRVAALELYVPMASPVVESFKSCVRTSRRIDSSDVDEGHRVADGSAAARGQDPAAEDLRDRQNRRAGGAAASSSGRSESVKRRPSMSDGSAGSEEEGLGRGSRSASSGRHSALSRGPSSTPSPRPSVGGESDSRSCSSG